MSRALWLPILCALLLAGCAGSPQKPDPLNLKELLSDIAFNLKSVDVNNFLLLLEHIN